MRILQWLFHFHRWTDWEEKSRGRTRMGDAFVEQERHCEKCKKIQMRTEVAYL